MKDVTLNNNEMILPSLYFGYDDFVKADLEEHCRFVKKAAEADHDLTELIFTSQAPLLIKVAAFEHFVMPKYREDSISHWIHDFITFCECKGNDSRMVHDAKREKWLCDHNGIDPNWEEPHQEVPFGVCTAYAKTICAAVQKVVDTVSLNVAAERLFTRLIAQHPEWIDTEAWSNLVSRWDDLECFLGQNFYNMAQVLYMLNTGFMPCWMSGCRTAGDCLWKRGWLDDACAATQTAEFVFC